jgi:hypothetical protein
MNGLSDLLETQRAELATRLRQRYVTRALPGWASRPTDLVRVILGPRRAGKSMVAAHLLEALGGGGYLNFDDERLAGITSADVLIAGIDALYGKPRRLLFDEIQNFPRWELMVNRLQREGRQLMVTGSNANLLGAELATHLTGRHQAITLLPFSFAEVLSAEEEIDTAATRAARLERYLHEGGYPEPLLRGVPLAEYLRDLVRATLLKDIVRRHRLRAPAGLESFAYHLFSSAGHKLSFRSLAKLGVVTSPTTAIKYLRLIEEAFLVFTVSRFSFKARERAKSDKKLYAIDPGLAAQLGTRPGADWGRLAENAVACALWRRKLGGNIDVGYWQNAQGEEVDFVVRRLNRVEELIQVCWSVTDERTARREWRALLKAGEELRCKRLVCIHHGPPARVPVTWQRWSGEIDLIPLAEWLCTP